MVDTAQFDAQCAEATKYSEKLFGPGKGIKIECDWSSFDKAEHSKEDALQFLTRWDGYYSVKEVRNGMYQLSSWEDDLIVDAVADGVDKIVIALEPGKDTQKKRFTFEDKTLTLYGVYEAESWSGVYDTSDIRSVLVEAGLAARPDLKLELLSSVCQNYYVRYGWFSALHKLIQNAELFHQPHEEAVASAKEQQTEGTYIKLFDNLTKINRHGRKQKRMLLINSSRFYTYEPSGNKCVSKNLQAHDYDKIICFDMYPLSSGPSIGTKEYGFTVYTDEVKEKKPSMFGNMKMPGVKLPGVKLPGVPLPDMPKVDLPDMPKVDLPDLPDVDISNPFKRHKEPKPKRTHPATKDKRFWTWVAEKGDTNQKNIDIQEACWVWYAGYASGTNRIDYIPFYLAKKQVFETSTQIEDTHRPPPPKAQKIEGTA